MLATLAHTSFLTLVCDRSIRSCQCSTTRERRFNVEIAKLGAATMNAALKKQYNEHGGSIKSVRPENLKVQYRYLSREMFGEQAVTLGRTRLSNDTISMLCERVAIERAKRERRWPLMGCAVCAGGGGKLHQCAGCRLTQYCSDECAHADAGAGHGALCDTLRDLETLYAAPPPFVNSHMALFYCVLSCSTMLYSRV